VGTQRATNGLYDVSLDGHGHGPESNATINQNEQEQFNVAFYTSGNVLLGLHNVVLRNLESDMMVDLDHGSSMVMYMRWSVC
jgi:hypothetical protein